MNIGQKIKEKRLKMGLTQEQLGNDLVSSSAISQIENAKIKPTYQLLCQIAQRLDTPIEYFISGEEDFFPPSASLTLAKAYVLNREFEKAEPLLDQLFEANSLASSELLPCLIQCKISQNKFDIALELCEEASKKAILHNDHSFYALSQFYFGILFSKKKNSTLALHYLHKTLDLLARYKITEYELHMNTYFELYHIYKILDDLELQHQILWKMVNFHDNHKSKLSNINFLIESASELYQKGEYQLSEKVGQEAIWLHTNLTQKKIPIDIKVLQASILINQGEVSNAGSILQEAIKEYEYHDLTDSIAEAYYQLANASLLSEDYENTSHFLERCIKQTDTGSVLYAKCLLLQSHIAEHHDDLSEALQLTEYAIDIFFTKELIQDFSHGCLRISGLYRKMNDYVSATEILEKSHNKILDFCKRKELRVFG